MWLIRTIRRLFWSDASPLTMRRSFRSIRRKRNSLRSAQTRSLSFLITQILPIGPPHKTRHSRTRLRSFGSRNACTGNNALTQQTISFAALSRFQYQVNPHANRDQSRLIHLGFEKLVVASTGYEAIELLHLNKTLKLLGTRLADNIWAC